MSNTIIITNNTAEPVVFSGAQIRPGQSQKYTSFAVNTLLIDERLLAGEANGDYTITNGDGAPITKRLKTRL